MWKMTLITILFFIIMFEWFSLCNSMFGMIYICMVLGGSFSIVPFRYDENFMWNNYQYAFPVTKKDVVCSRYLYGVVVSVICVLIAVLSIIIKCIVTTDRNILYVCSVHILPVCIVPIIQACSYPLTYCFGVKKNGYATVLLIAMVIACYNIVKQNDFLYQLQQHYGVILFSVLTATVLLYVLSMLFSIKIEQKK